MAYTKKYPQRIDWENEPSTATPLHAQNLNKMDYALREIDQTLYDMDSTIQEEIQDAEAWAKGTRDGSDVPSTDPAYHNNSKYYAEQAEEEAVDSQNSSYDSEAWAKGTRNGQDVPSTDPAYHNNAKYYSEQSDPTSFANMSDVNFTNLQNGQVPKYNSTTQMWENGTGGGAEAIPTYNISIDATPTNDSPIIIPGVDFTQPFKLILRTTVSASTIDLGYIYINDGTTTNLYYAYYKRSDSTGVQSAATSTKIRYDTSGYVCCLEFLCFKNRQSAYVALCGTDDAVSMSSLADVTLTSLSNNDILKYNSTTQKWENGTVPGGASNLEDLGDVEISASVSNNQVLTYVVGSGGLGTWQNKDGLPIPIYNVTISSAPSSSSPIVLNGVDFTKPFKLIISTTSTTALSLSNLYISNGSTSHKYEQKYMKAGNAYALISASTTIKYGSSSYPSSVEFLCEQNASSSYIAIKGPGITYDVTNFLKVKAYNTAVDTTGDSIDIDGNFVLFTYEYNASTEAYRGQHVYFISAKPDTVTPQAISLGSSSNTGVTVTYGNSGGNQPYVSIKASSSTYKVDYALYEFPF